MQILLKQLLTAGWVHIRIENVLKIIRGGVNCRELDVDTLVQGSDVVTIIASDLPFDVPSTIGGVNVIADRQHVFTSRVLLLGLSFRGMSAPDSIDLCRLYVYEDGCVISSIRTDGPFSVPASFGSVTVRDSIQHQFSDLAHIEIRVVEK